jgi:hypothetical protein
MVLELGDVTIHVTLGIGNFFDIWVSFKGLLVKSYFSSFVNIR